MDYFRLGREFGFKYTTHKIVIGMIAVSAVVVLLVNIYYQQQLMQPLRFAVEYSLAAFVAWVLMRELEPRANLPALLMIPLMAFLPPDYWRGLLLILSVVVSLRLISGITGYIPRLREFSIVLLIWVASITLAVMDSPPQLLGFDQLDPLALFGLAGLVLGSLLGINDSMECDNNQTYVSSRRLLMARVFYGWVLIALMFLQLPGAGLMLIAGMVFGIHKFFDLLNSFILDDEVV